MKILSIICVLIVTALNLVPCGDVHGKEFLQTSVSSSDAGNHHDAPAVDFCTPFCHCACCGSHVVTTVLNSSSAVVGIDRNDNLFYIVRHCPNAGQSIWQPPKLAA